jgi:hypothetical protein
VNTRRIKVRVELAELALIGLKGAGKPERNAENRKGEVDSVYDLVTRSDWLIKLALIEEEY